ncbi:MAG: hypothetical protein ACREVV_07900 [Steroidobacteraceae bacterium]
MIFADERSCHEEVWLLLPWLANGRLAPSERERAEEHVRRCCACERELALQHLTCGALTEPDRVTYAPAPSFRKLMDRIDAEGHRTAERARQAAPRGLAARLGNVSLWRPPGLAWAASFLMLFGITGLLATAYRWSEPVYRTHTDTAAATPNVLHIALDRSLTIADVEEMMRANGARVVEGPGNTGVFGVAPAGVVSGQTSAEAARQRLRQLSARLRADPRVLWVQPLAEDATPANRQAPPAQEH